MSDERIDPQGWVTTNVETASSEIISGSGFPKEYQGEAIGDYPFAKVGDISKVFRAKQKYISSAGHFISEKVRGEIKARVFPKGAIVFPKIGEALKGNYRVVTNREMLFDNNVMGIIPDTKLISGDFFYYFLTTQDFGRFAVATAVPSVRRGDIASISLSLPPRPEQHRIVSKIEELFSELDKGIENLQTAHAQLKVYRQALLKHAFEGKLTAQWRAENQDKLETAADLQKRIQQERAQRYQQHPDWETAGKQGSKPKAPKALPPLTSEELAELPALPKGWGWLRVSHLLAEDLCNGKSVKDRVGGFPVLRLNALANGEIDLSVTKSGDWSKEQARQYFVNEDDFLVSRGNGSKHLVGRGGFAKYKSTDPEPVAFPDTMIRIRLLNKNINKRYFSFCWDSFLLRNQIETSARTTAGIYKINQELIEAFVLPLSCIEEQEFIATCLSERLSIVDQLDQTITASLQQAEALRQSILKKAFSGRLVPQDPQDEPASALLARIKAEKSTLPLAKGPRSRRDQEISA